MSAVARRSESIHQDILDESHGLQEELLVALNLKKIGGGVYRNVYATENLPNAVFKLEIAGVLFCNAMEWRIWGEVADTEIARWFAPCLNISYNGGVLIQQRAKILTDWSKGVEIPDFFMDAKPENFGRIGKQIVCVDYGSSKILERGISKFRMVPPASLRAR